MKRKQPPAISPEADYKCKRKKKQLSQNLTTISPGLPVFNVEPTILDIQESELRPRPKKICLTHHLMTPKFHNENSSFFQNLNAQFDYMDYSSLNLNKNFLCRAKQLQAIRNYLLGVLSQSRERILYICGTPGSGKTAMVATIITDLKKKAKKNFDLIKKKLLFEGKETGDTKKKSRHTKKDDLDERGTYELDVNEPNKQQCNMENHKTSSSCSCQISLENEQCLCACTDEYWNCHDHFCCTSSCLVCYCDYSYCNDYYENAHTSYCHDMYCTCSPCHGACSQPICQNSQNQDQKKQLEHISSSNSDSSFFSKHIVFFNCTTFASNKNSLIHAIASQLISSIQQDCVLSLPSPECYPDEMSWLRFLLFDAVPSSYMNTMDFSQFHATIESGTLFHLILLDEIDQLPTHQYKELQQLLEWAQEPQSTLALIILANRHNLIQEITTTSQNAYSGILSQSNTIQIIRFKPYTHQKLEYIFRTRFELIQKFFDPKAIKFLAMKISKLPGEQAGDVRVLLDIVRKIIASVLHNFKPHDVGESSSRLPIVDLQTVMQIWNERTLAIEQKSRVENLTLFQKIVLASVILETKATPNAQFVKYNQVKIIYKKLISQLHVSAKLAEFEQLVTLLDKAGLLTFKKSKLQNKSFIQLRGNMDEILDEFKNDVILKTFL
ncbi:uncharacterized protein LOC126319870 [Schistocerca gregaria]|uniref:uncharacterized protein LOC126319870 n=1 Tax=Schistocerca gregaria TaxID=7010 RepID=UPI00211F06D7|nr:uncharacterized protein LOC126319870 [Schistocerca gregaria]XP_049849516.1 uncharacterized protein LOC126319870 [Schistocerca gregaria]